MGLPSDLIAQFVKVTNEKTETKQETTTYATVVEYEGSTYVKIDGSDLLTPATFTTDVSADDRVVVLIKNHAALVTSNITDPSASSKEVVELGTKISDFEIVVADKVSTKEFDAVNGRIDNLLADNVAIRETLSASEAVIGDLKAENVEIEGKLTAAEVDISKMKTEKLDATAADIKYATIESLDATNATVNNLNATYGEFVDLTTKDLTAKQAEIDTLKTDKLDANTAKLLYASIEQLNAQNAKIENVEAGVADIDTLIFGSATGTSIHTSFANAVIAQLGNAQIKAAMIQSVSADQITAGDILTDNVRVMSEDGKLVISDETIQISDDSRVRVQIGKDSSNDYSINIWDADGNLMFSEGGITDNAIKEAIIRNDMVSDDANISASKLDISSLFTEINESTETIKSSKIYLDGEKQTLDVAFTSMSQNVDALDSTVKSQGSALSVVENQIASKVWQQDIDDANDEMSTKYTELNQTVNGLSTTVGQHESDIDSVEEQMSTVQQDVNGFKVTVSDTYATKSEIEEGFEDIRTELSDATHSMTTEIKNTSTQVILSALESYVQTNDYEAFRQIVETQLSVMSNEITMNFEKTSSSINSVDEDVQGKFTQLYKHIKFTSDTAISIGSGDSSITLEIDNESGIVFKKNGVQFGWWDGVDFHTGNIVVDVNERAQFGNFAYVPRSDGALMFLKVGG